MVKVTICGATGGIGHPLSVLLKQVNLIDHLSLYDIVNTQGVAIDLSHIDTKGIVTGHVGHASLKEAVQDSDIILIPAVSNRRPKTPQELFRINALSVRDIADAAARYSPKAFMVIMSNPVNQAVPIVVEVFKKHKVYDPRRIFGVTTLDIVHASTLVAYFIDADPRSLRIPVVGGHSGLTIVPLISQVKVSRMLSQSQIEAVTRRVQFCSDNVINVEDGLHRSPLSIAYAASRFIFSLLNAIINGKTVVEYTYLNLDADPVGAASIRAEVGELEYFAPKVDIGPQGVVKIHPLGPISSYEKRLLRIVSPVLKEEVKKGVSFVHRPGYM
ncbi:malate dehydrogenase, NAD-dependent [Jimgerdemannia flammicorona]|uniref:Malate dehydrogenase, NAD-dependent n=2 Tax=Jimgerdemannia flammicorona TaxID=994334 RepID=A0A433QYW4_9FUNG|nr:malate dehydrogenase, NAD-dependent [Jimgerdemannia flammicorona]RUS34969.1 malate dehydrogenase, NAD-dependent [Jimgerdemannia flammicorona]